MKKLYLEKREQFLEWLASKFYRLIVELYARVQTKFKSPFVISVHEIHEKKGKTKYTILFIETKLGQYKFWVQNGRVIIDDHPAFLKTKETPSINFNKK